MSDCNCKTISGTSMNSSRTVTPARAGIFYKVCVCPSTTGVKPVIKMIDNTCGPTFVTGPDVIQRPTYDSATCEQIRCERQGPCLILKLRTGDPTIPQPQYCPQPPPCD